MQARDEYERSAGDNHNIILMMVIKHKVGCCENNVRSIIVGHFDILH